MDDQTADTARAAAKQLAGEHGSHLPGEVEAVLRSGRDHAAFEQYHADTVSFATLIVTAAQLAWTVYHDLKAKSSGPAPAVVERHLRVKLRLTETDEPPMQRDRMISVVVAEVVARDPQPPAPE